MLVLDSAMKNNSSLVSRLLSNRVSLKSNIFANSSLFLLRISFSTVTSLVKLDRPTSVFGKDYYTHSRREKLSQIGKRIFCLYQKLPCTIILFITMSRNIVAVVNLLFQQLFVRSLKLSSAWFGYNRMEVVVLDGVNLSVFKLPFLSH